MYKIIECEQGSDAWFQARLGKPTASVFDKFITKTGKKSAQSDEMINRLVAEKIMGEPDETFQSEAMLRGKELEDDALRFLNFTRDLSLKPCGFVDSGNGYGCSPDAIDEENKTGLELKCPMPHTHLAYLCAGYLPDKYMQQVQGSMLVTGFKRWIFMSYHPVIESMVVTVERDDEYIEKMEKILVDSCSEIETKYKKLSQITGLAG